MFLAPAFLFGLLAVGVPLWLHRVARANPTQHPFASLMLLEASETQRTAKRTLRYWLLLALRIALLVALVLAFAGPMVKDTFVPKAGADARLHAIVVDNSMSMQYGDRWQRAVEAAEVALSRVRPSDRVTLATGAGQRVDILQNSVPGSDAGVIRNTLRSMKPGIQRFDYGLAMSTAGNWLGSPRPPVTVHLVTDVQSTAAPLRFADLEPPPGADLMIQDVSGSARGDMGDNTYIDAATLASADTRSLQVDVRTTSAKVQQRQVILTIDGREYARRNVEVPGMPRSIQPRLPEQVEGGGQDPLATDRVGNSDSAEPTSATVLFSDLELTAGTHRLEVVLEPRDGLAQDDRYYAVIEHADPKALLIVRSSNADDAAYFASAIGSLAAPRLTVEQRSGDGMDRGSLTGYSLVVIADTGVLSDVMATRIRDYVSAGGAVLATLGSDVLSRGTPLLNGISVGESHVRSSHVGEISTSHPVLRDAGDWHRVRFFRQRLVQVSDGDRVLITHDDGSPLLVERTLGAGRMLVLTEPVDRAWNDLAIHPLFVQFIAASARYLIGPDASAASAVVGSTVMTGLTAAGGGQIFDPQGKRVLGLGEAGAERLVPDQVGFYEIRSNDGVRWLAVNVDPRESDLSPLRASFLQRWQALVRRPVGRATQEARPGESRGTTEGAAPVASQSDGAPRALGPGLMWFAALLLLAELLLANRYLAVRREVPK